MTRRHPDEALVSNPKDTAPPRGRPGQQSSRHGASQTTPCSPILMTRRHPHHALVSNPQDLRHGATERTGRPAIPMAQRHPRETPSSNPHGTAPPTRHAQQQSPWHSGTHATRPAGIPMAQRRTRHSRDTPDAHRHSLPLRSTAQRRARDTPDAAAPLRSEKRPLQAHIRKSTDSLRLPRFRNAQHAPAHAICRTGPRNPAILATAHDSLRLPRGSTVQSASMHPKSHTGRSASNHARARDTPRTQSPRHGAADTARQHAPSTLPARTIPAACHAKRTLAMRVQNTPGTQSPRHSATARPLARPRHTSNTPDPRSLPAKRCPGPKNAHGATRRRSQCTRRHSESVAPSRIPAQGHGFENLVGATPPP